MVLNPYDLLGVTPGNTCQQVKKRYYALACLCHPDRGGTNEQMQTLHNAYEFIMQQVALNTTATYEDLEEEFSTFCAAQTAAPPTFYDIHANAFNLPRFNELFEKCEEVDGAFETGGYHVVPSEASMEYTPVESSPIDPFSSELVMYTEPAPCIMPQTLVRDLTQTPLNTYSCKFGKLTACDYQSALSPPVDIPTPVSDCNVLVAFQERIGNYGF